MHRIKIGSHHLWELIKNRELHTAKLKYELRTSALNLHASEPCSLGWEVDLLWLVFVISKVFNFGDLIWQGVALLWRIFTISSWSRDLFHYGWITFAMVRSCLQLLILWITKFSLVTSKFTQNIKSCLF